jgi:hypothetical protein
MFDAPVFRVEGFREPHVCHDAFDAENFAANARKRKPSWNFEL